MGRSSAAPVHEHAGDRSTAIARRSLRSCDNRYCIQCPTRAPMTELQSMAEEFFEFGDFGVGLVEIFLGVGGVAVLEGVVGFFEEEAHALLGGDHIGAEAEAGGGLLLLESVEAFGDGVGADAEFFTVVGEALNLVGGWAEVGWRDGGGRAGWL